MTRQVSNGFGWRGFAQRSVRGVQQSFLIFSAHNLAKGFPARVGLYRYLIRELNIKIISRQTISPEQDSHDSVASSGPGGHDGEAAIV